MSGFVGKKKPISPKVDSGRACLFVAFGIIIHTQNITAFAVNITAIGYFQQNILPQLDIYKKILPQLNIYTEIITTISVIFTGKILPQLNTRKILPQFQ